VQVKHWQALRLPQSDLCLAQPVPLLAHGGAVPVFAAAQARGGGGMGMSGGAAASLYIAAAEAVLLSPPRAAAEEVLHSPRRSLAQLKHRQALRLPQSGRWLFKSRF